ncbi:putative reverse transcriptase domain-containing protein [Tanacetum coccineum]
MDQEEAFQTLKDKLCNATILSLSDGAKDFVVYYDASNQGLGCVLMQRGKAEIGENRLVGLELVQETTDKVILIKERLKAYLADSNLHVPVEEIKVVKTLCFVEEPVEIIDREVKSLKRSRVLIVKVH